MTRISSTETYSTEGPQCPHCGIRITADEGFYYDENRYTEDECPDCDKKFKIEVHTSTTWTCTAPDAPVERFDDGTRDGTAKDAP